MALQGLTFELPEWSSVEFSWVKQQSATLNRMSQSAGRGNNSYKKALREIMALVSQKRVEELLALLRESRLHGRVFASSLLSSESFRQSVVITKRAVEALISTHEQTSRLTLSYVVEAYFKHYQSLFDVQAVATLRKRLEIQKSKFYKQFTGFELVDAAIKHPNTLVVKDAHSIFVNRCVREGRSLNDAFSWYGISEVLDSEFQKACQSAYYIQKLMRLKPGQDSPILSEIVDPDIFGLRFNETKVFGHRFVELLVDKSNAKEVSEPWREAILGIAGDPRLGTHTPQYQRWWAVLGEERTKKMISWMSQLDVRLFLKVLVESSQDSRNSDLRRMFADRVDFLNALLDSGKVVLSKLFLSYEAVGYIKRNHPNIDTNLFGRCDDWQLSVIYLDLGGAHVFEGTHQYALKIFPQLVPEHHRYVHSGSKSWPKRVLGPGLQDTYEAEADRPADYIRLTHNGGNWPRRAQEYLRKKGVRFIV